MVKHGSKREDTAGQICESLRIQEFILAAGNQKLQQLGSWLPLRLWNVLEGFPHLRRMH
jgi:hypothetical protein